MYLKYVENVIPLSKLIGLLFLFCLPLLSILLLKSKRNDLARPVMGTIFLVIGCTLLITSCEAERSFSSLRLTINYLWSSMGGKTCCFNTHDGA